MPRSSVTSKKMSSRKRVREREEEKWLSSGRSIECSHGFFLWLFLISSLSSFFPLVFGLLLLFEKEKRKKREKQSNDTPSGWRCCRLLQCNVFSLLSIWYYSQHNGTTFLSFSPFNSINCLLTGSPFFPFPLLRPSFSSLFRQILLILPASHHFVLVKDRQNESTDSDRITEREWAESVTCEQKSLAHILYTHFLSFQLFVTLKWRFKHINKRDGRRRKGLPGFGFFFRFPGIREAWGQEDINAEGKRSRVPNFHDKRKSSSRQSSPCDSLSLYFSFASLLL